jgi:hypothetical protein
MTYCSSGNKTGLAQIERVGTSVRTYKATNDVLLKKRVSSTAASTAASGAFPVDSKPPFAPVSPFPSQVSSGTYHRDKVAPELKQMGYSEQQIDSAIGKGCTTLESCVEYFLSLDQETSKRSKADQPDASSPFQATISEDTKQLVNAEAPCISWRPPVIYPHDDPFFRRSTKVGFTELPTRAKSTKIHLSPVMA